MLEGERKIDKVLDLQRQALLDIDKVKKLLQKTPDDKGLVLCLNQVISTHQACVVFFRILSEDEDMCWSVNCTYYNNNDHYIKSDGSINKWCLGCCQALERLIIKEIEEG
jgi:hypothetical protein